MARRTDHSIHLSSIRKNLLPRREPYWRALSRGGHIGFRKSATGSETFIARWRDSKGRRHYNSLGAISYADAKTLTEEWIAERRAGVVTTVTVQSGLESYVANLRAENRVDAALDAEQRFQREVYGSELSDTLLRDLTAMDIERWRDTLRSGRSAATVNRNLNSLKAALNYAFKRRLVSSDFAWKVVGRLTVDMPANVQYLSIDQRRCLVNNAPDDLSRFVTALMYTGARPGEIARCRAEDFDSASGALILRSKKGTKRRLRERIFVLSGDSVTFFRRQHLSKHPRAFLFVTSDGSPWVKWLWSRRFRSTISATNLPLKSTAYAIRHSVITDWLKGGIDVGTVAKATGTSIQMINDYYFKSLPDAASMELSRICVI